LVIFQYTIISIIFRSDNNRYIFLIWNTVDLIGDLWIELNDDHVLCPRRHFVSSHFRSFAGKKNNIHPILSESCRCVHANMLYNEYLFYKHTHTHMHMHKHKIVVRLRQRVCVQIAWVWLIGRSSRVISPEDDGRHPLYPSSAPPVTYLPYVRSKWTDMQNRYRYRSKSPPLDSLDNKSALCRRTFKFHHS